MLGRHQLGLRPHHVVTNSVCVCVCVCACMRVCASACLATLGVNLVRESYSYILFSVIKKVNTKQKVHAVKEHIEVAFYVTRALLRLERTMNLLEGGKRGEGRMGEGGWGGDGGRVGRARGGEREGGE